MPPPRDLRPLIVCCTLLLLLAPRTTVTQSTPIVVDVAASHHILLLLSDGTVLGAVDNRSGQLGLPPSNVPVVPPTRIPLPGKVVQVAVGGRTSYALLEDGTVWAWGYGYSGELGVTLPSGTFRSTPAAVPGLQCPRPSRRPRLHALSSRPQRTSAPVAERPRSSRAVPGSLARAPWLGHPDARARILARMNPKPQPSRQSLGPLPAALVAQLTSAVGAPTSHLLVDGQPQVRQDGWTLGENQVDDTEGEGHITDVEVCLLKSGAILTSIVSITGRADSHIAHVHDTPEEAAQWLAKHCHGRLEAPAQAAWSQACDTLPALLTSHGKK